MSFRILLSIVASLLAASAFCAEPKPNSSNPCAGYGSAQYACDGYCVWGDPDEEKTRSFTTEIVSSIGWVEVLDFGTQPNVAVTFEYPLSETWPITHLDAVVSGFYIELEDGAQISEIKVKADVDADSIGPCIAVIGDSAGDQAADPCVLWASVTPYINVKTDGDAAPSIAKAYMKVAVIGKQVFDACDAGVPIIAWSDPLAVFLSSDDPYIWEVEGISTDGESYIKNYPFQSEQPLAPIAFFTDFLLEFEQDHQLRKIVVDPDAGTYVPGEGFKSSMVYDDDSGYITGTSKLQLKANSYDAVSGSMDLVVMANALQPSPFALPSGTTNWYKPERSGAENKTISEEQKEPVFNSSHQIASEPAPPILLRSWSVEMPSPVSFCRLNLYTDYLSLTGTDRDCPQADCSGNSFPSGMALTEFDLLVTSEGADGSCIGQPDGAEGSAKFFLLGQEPIPIEARPFPPAATSASGDGD